MTAPNRRRVTVPDSGSMLGEILGTPVAVPSPVEKTERPAPAPAGPTRARPARGRAVEAPPVPEANTPTPMVQIGPRISAALNDELDKFCRDRRISKQDVIAFSLRWYMDAVIATEEANSTAN